MKIFRLLSAFSMLAIFAGCYEVGHFDRPGGYDPGSSAADIRGTVTLSTPAYNSIAMDTANGSYTFVYDAQTLVRYRNSAFPAQDIRAGDELSVIPRPNSGGSFPTADAITVMSRRSSGGNVADIRGRVTLSTPSYNSIAMDTANGSYTFVYDAQTLVRYRNSAFPAQDIRAGDELSVIPRPNSGGSFPIADVITVMSRR